MRLFGPLLLMSLTVAPLFAQTESLPSKTVEISVNGGLSLPSLPSEFKSYWKKGTDVGAGIGYSLEPGSVGYGALELKVDWNGYSFDKSAYQSSLPANKQSDSIAGSSTNIITAFVTFRGTFSPSKTSVAPYFLLGIGYFSVSSKDVTVKPDAVFSLPDESQSSVAWMVGAGIDLPLGDKWGVFADGRYILGVNQELGRQYFPVTLGVRIKP